MATGALAAHDLATDAVTAAVAYPIDDLLVLFAVALVLLRGVDAGVRRPLYFVAAGMPAPTGRSAGCPTSASA